MQPMIELCYLNQTAQSGLDCTVRFKSHIYFVTTMHSSHASAVCICFKTGFRGLDGTKYKYKMSK